VRWTLMVLLSYGTIVKAYRKQHVLFWNEPVCA
jgi:hypothetical protein